MAKTRGTNRLSVDVNQDLFTDFKERVERGTLRGLIETFIKALVTEVKKNPYVVHDIISGRVEINFSIAKKAAKVG